ncbi:MAG: ROK family protein [Proteobacteria bacterium]|nr:ROK family protein [Pseudomonadota bacterium]
MAKKKQYAIGVDIGGTNMPCSLVDDKGKILRTIEKKTLPEQGADSLALRISESVKELLTYFKGRLKKGTILGVGLGVPGILDHKRGEIVTCPNLPGWKNVPIIKLIKQKLKMPVLMDNDANCAVIGEHWIGAAKGTKNAILLTLGSGVGGGIIIDNKIYRGSHGVAGELGHITIVAEGALCGCGNHGCLEAYASANAAARTAKERLRKEEVISTLREKDINKITAHDIFLHAEAGDIFSKNILFESGKYLGMGIATFANIFDPDIIIIGGGFSDAEKYLLPAAIDEAYKRAFKHVMDKMKIKKAKLGNNAGMIGAARLFF